MFWRFSWEGGGVVNCCITSEQVCASFRLMWRRLSELGSAVTHVVCRDLVTAVVAKGYNSIAYAMASSQEPELCPLAPLHPGVKWFFGFELRRQQPYDCCQPYFWSQVSRGGITRRLSMLEQGSRRRACGECHLPEIIPLNLSGKTPSIAHQKVAAGENLMRVNGFFPEGQQQYYNRSRSSGKLNLIHGAMSSPCPGWRLVVSM